MSKTTNANEQGLPSLKGQKVLITGGFGFIGSNVAHRCLSLGAEVSIFDCLDPHSGGNIYNIKSIQDSLHLYYNDILNFDCLSSVVVNQDIIISCAASTSHSTSMREPWLDQNINGIGMINILEAIRRFNPEAKFIHLGTTTQLGKLQYSPADEHHPEFPTDIYSANKMVSEKYAMIYANAHNLRATVLRVANVFGPRASIHSAEFTFNNFFIGLALQGRDITVFGSGQQKRNVIYVDDVVDAIVLTSQQRGTDADVFFLAGDEHHSVAGIAQATIDRIGSGAFRLVPWPVGREQVDVGDAVISNQKLKAAIDWRPRVGLDEGLGKTRDYFHDCLDKYLR